MEVVKTIVVAVIGSGLLNLILNRIFAKVDKKKDEKSGLKQALRLLMKDRLRFLCSHYITQTWIYEDELDDLISMHKCYHDGLGGNGFLDTLMGKVKSLEIRGRGVK